MRSQRERMYVLGFMNFKEEVSSPLFWASLPFPLTEYYTQVFVRSEVILKEAYRMNLSTESNPKQDDTTFSKVAAILSILK